MKQPAARHQSVEARDWDCGRWAGCLDRRGPIGSVLRNKIIEESSLLGQSNAPGVEI